MDEHAAPLMPSGWKIVSRRAIVALGACAVVALLVALVVINSASSQARDLALARERHSYEITALATGLEASLARAEAALGRYVANGERETGTTYLDEWRRAGHQIDTLARSVGGDPAQTAAIAELRRLYEKRREELAAPALRATYKQGLPALSLFAKAGASDTLRQIDAVLDRITRHEQELLGRRADNALVSTEWSNRVAGTMSIAGVLLVLVALGFAWLAAQALAARRAARELADAESDRAGALARAVAERTRELSEANAQLIREGEERRLAEAQRAEAEQQLRQVQKMEAVGQLTGGIAHDFNNMLSVVVGGLDIARRRVAQEAEEVTRHIDNALEGANRAAALTRRLLTFSRAEPLLPQSVDPAQLIRGMQDLIDRTIGERIAVEIACDDQCWPVWVDGYQLENAILNLAVNARDAMEGAGRIIISIANRPAMPATAELAAGDYVVIGVTDTGSGIDAATLERVFEPFFTTKPVGKGTGLGLSQIFGFARQSGGTVQIASTVGVGTTVSMILPRSSGAAPAQALEPAIADAAAPTLSIAGQTILVVEDDPRVRTSTTAALEELDYQVLAVGSADEALAVLAGNRRIDLILTDVMMPGITGPELVRIAAERHRTVPALFVTGYVGSASEAEQFAGHDVLRKPFTVNGLAAAVQSALTRANRARAA